MTKRRKRDESIHVPGFGTVIKGAPPPSKGPRYQVLTESDGDPLTGEPSAALLRLLRFDADGESQTVDARELFDSRTGRTTWAPAERSRTSNPNEHKRGTVKIGRIRGVYVVRR